MVVDMLFDSSEVNQILVFVLDEPRYALPLSAVERVERAVAITPLPLKHRYIQGVINMQGQIIPVVDIRQCFGMPAHEINETDLFILAQTHLRLIALVADSVVGIHELTSHDLINANQILPGAAFIHGIAKVEGDLILLCDLDQFLSLEDENKLESALKEIAKKLPARNSLRPLKCHEHHPP